MIILSYYMQLFLNVYSLTKIKLSFNLFGKILKKNTIYSESLKNLLNFKCESLLNLLAKKYFRMFSSPNLLLNHVLLLVINTKFLPSVKQIKGEIYPDQLEQDFLFSSTYFSDWVVTFDAQQCIFQGIFFIVVDLRCKSDQLKNRLAVCHRVEVNHPTHKIFIFLLFVD